MGFNSPLFIVFLSIVVLVNYLLPARYRPILLLSASYAFIGFFNIESLITVVGFSAFNFFIAKRLLNNRSLFLFGIVANTIAIVLFNYFNASHSGLQFELQVINFNLERFIIALGLSFYSLQNIGYLSDIYFKRESASKNLIAYLLSVAFFPKIISGPVTSSSEFINQIEQQKFTPTLFAQGFNRFLIGLFKKMVIADRLAPSIESIFDYGDTYPGLTTLMGVYLFTIQLYFDFSGYTDMAIGAGKMLTINLKENFNYPLRATSIAEFWRRWHISLINWFSNHIYYPLVFRLRNHKKTAPLIGIAITFLISAVWHGIGLTFLCWGLCHMVYLSIEFFTKKARFKPFKKGQTLPNRILRTFLVFNAVCFSNIFFRAHSFDIALHVIKNIFSNFTPTDWLAELIAPLAVGGHQIEQFNLLATLVFLSGFILFERTLNNQSNKKKVPVFFTSVLIISILMFGIFDNGARFIYMQF